MNISYKKVSALVFSAIVTASACGMEHENTTHITTQPVVTAWYKKSSVQAAAAAVTLAVVGYACAVRMGTVAVPAFVAGLVAVKSVQDTKPMDAPVNNNDVPVNNNNIQETDTQVQDNVQPVVNETVVTTSNFDIKKAQELFAAELSKIELSQKFMQKSFQEQ